MEHTDRELILRAIKNDVRIRRLYEEHQRLESRIASLERRRFLLPQEELEAKRLKKEKLRGVDEMLQIVGGGAGAAA